MYEDRPWRSSDDRGDDGSIMLPERLARIERSIERLRTDTENRFTKIETTFGMRAFLAFVGITGSGWGVAVGLGVYILENHH